MLNDIKQWSKETFPNQSSNSVTYHFNEEVTELYVVTDQVDKGIDVGERSIGEEIADCIILLCALAGVYDIDVEAAIRTKHEVNKVRKFEFVPKVGYHKRVKETA